MTSAAKQQQQTRHKDNEKINKLYIIYYTKYRSYTMHEVWKNYFWNVWQTQKSSTKCS